MEQILSEYDEARREKAPNLRDLATTIVAENPALFEPFAGLSLETCVGMVSGYRAAGRTAESIAADIWCQAEFGPQTITGTMHTGG
jgi:hypothetical protein